MHEGKLINPNPLDEIFDRFYRGEISEPELTFHVVTSQGLAASRRDAAMMDLVVSVEKLMELQKGEEKEERYDCCL